MAIIENYVVTEDSIIIPKQELERLIEHYDKQIKSFWNPKPFVPQSWGVGLFQGKREMCTDFLNLINKSKV